MNDLTRIAMTLTLMGASGIGFYFLWRTPDHSAFKIESVSAPSFLPCAPPNIRLGMTSDEVRAICGPPAHVSHQLIGENHDNEQWSYREPRSYVYLLNGVVNSVQYAENGQSFKWNDR